jgi:hypothetical protein
MGTGLNIGKISINYNHVKTHSNLGFNPVRYIVLGNRLLLSIRTHIFNFVRETC